MPPSTQLILTSTQNKDFQTSTFRNIFHENIFGALNIFGQRLSIFKYPLFVLTPKIQISFLCFLFSHAPCRGHVVTHQLGSELVPQLLTDTSISNRHSGTGSLRSLSFSP